MEIRFVSPDLHQLDLIVTELLAVPVALGERPPTGCAGLVDYRLAGRVSEVIQSGALSGQVGEKVFIRGRPKLPFDKILLYGAGDDSKFNPQIFGGIVEDLSRTFSEMGVRRAVVELPGRAKELITPELSAEVLLERIGKNPQVDTWTLVDTPAAQRAVSGLMRRDRRSQWGVG